MMSVCPDLDACQADNGGDQPLHLAAYHGHLPVVRLLIRAGADPSQANDAGYTPIELATGRRYWSVARYLGEFRTHEADKEIGKEEPVNQMIPQFRRPADLIEAAAVNSEALEFKNRWDDVPCTCCPGRCQKNLPKPTDGTTMMARDEMVEQLHKLAKKLVAPPEVY